MRGNHLTVMQKHRVDDCVRVRGIAPLSVVKAFNGGQQCNMVACKFKPHQNRALHAEEALA